MATRLVAAELKAMKRPSLLIEGVLLSELPCVPSLEAESKVVRGWQPEVVEAPAAAAPVQVSRKKICVRPFCVAV